MLYVPVNNLSNVSTTSFFTGLNQYKQWRIWSCSSTHCSGSAAASVKLALFYHMSKALSTEQLFEIDTNVIFLYPR